MNIKAIVNTMDKYLFVPSNFFTAKKKAAIAAIKNIVYWVIST
jgi:hypothetical protein